MAGGPIQLEQQGLIDAQRIGRNGETRTHPLGRLARSLTRREDWPRDAVGARWRGGNSLPPLPVVQVAQPGDRPLEPSGHGSRKPKPAGDAATPERRRRRTSGPGAQGTRSSWPAATAARKPSATRRCTEMMRIGQERLRGVAAMAGLGERHRC